MSDAPLAQLLTLDHASPTRNRVHEDDSAFHNWYRFVLAFPPHLVRDYLGKLGAGSTETVLDPFCGTGTTLVEAKKAGHGNIGVEINPIAHLATRVKTDWRVNCGALVAEATSLASAAASSFMRLQPLGLDELAATLPPASMAILLAGSISPVPLHKILLLRDLIRAHASPRLHGHLLLALARITVFDASNLRFGPEVGVGRRKEDAPVFELWLEHVQQMGADLAQVQGSNDLASEAYLCDSRDLRPVLAPRSVDIVITSPPYPNEKDYTRTTRLESVILGMITDKEQLRQLKKRMVRSNTRGVYSVDDDDDYVRDHPEIQRIAAAIEARRIELGKTSGFERMYPRVTKLYFGGMARHLANLRPILRPGARLAYVVGDQASYLRIMIRTGTILADLAQELGYEVLGIDLFRTRVATATKDQLREEVVLLRWRG